MYFTHDLCKFQSSSIHYVLIRSLIEHDQPQYNVINPHPETKKQQAICVFNTKFLCNSWLSTITEVKIIKTADLELTGYDTLISYIILIWMGCLLRYHVNLPVITLAA